MGSLRYKTLLAFFNNLCANDPALLKCQFEWRFDVASFDWLIASVSSRADSSHGA